LILMPATTQMSLNQYMISLINCTTLAFVMEVAGFTSIHFVNLSTVTKMCVNHPLAFLSGPTISSPRGRKGQVWSGVDETTHVSREQRIGNLHSDEPRIQRLTKLWASRTPTDTSCPQAYVHLCDYRKSLSECAKG
jgi:hypothetical protein